MSLDECMFCVLMEADGGAAVWVPIAVGHGVEFGVDEREVSDAVKLGKGDALFDDGRCVSD